MAPTVHADEIRSDAHRLNGDNKDRPRASFRLIALHMSYLFQTTSLRAYLILIALITASVIIY